MKSQLKFALIFSSLFCFCSPIWSQSQSLTASQLLKIADDWERKDFDSAYYYSKQALEVSRADKDYEIQIKSLNNVGYALSTLSRYPEAYAAHQDALALAKETKDTSQIAKTLNFLGVYYNELSDYDEAQKYFSESYELRHYLKDTVGIAITSGNLGLNYYRLKQYDLAEKFMKVTVEIDSMNNDSLYLIGGLTNIGLVYKFTDRLDESERVTQKALDISRKLNSKVDEGLTLGNLGMIYLQKKEYEQAEDYLEQSLAIRRVNGKPRWLTRTYANFVSLYQEWGKYDKALMFADSASYYNEIVKNKRQEAKTLQNKVEIYEALGDYRKAYENQTKLSALKDTMADSDRIQRLASVEGRLNLLEKENEIVKQEFDINRLQVRNQRIVFGGLTALLGLAVAYLFRSRSFNKRNAELQRQFAQDLIQSTEDERKRISSELHDSIGQSLLLIKNKILFNPDDVKKDIGIVDNAIDEVRTISQALHPYQFEKLGLAKSLEYLIDQFQSNSNTFYSSDIDNEEIKLPEKKGIYVYRILQECINNVEKHANAKACNLLAEKRADHYLFQVKDNGKGFDLTENSQLLNSLGMKTLRERAQIIGAQLVIDSTLGRGTTVQLKVPFE